MEPQRKRTADGGGPNLVTANLNTHLLTYCGTGHGKPAAVEERPLACGAPLADVGPRAHYESTAGEMIMITNELTLMMVLYSCSGLARKTHFNTGAEGLDLAVNTTASKPPLTVGVVNGVKTAICGVGSRVNTLILILPNAGAIGFGIRLARTLFALVEMVGTNTMGSKGHQTPSEARRRQSAKWKVALRCIGSETDSNFYRNYADKSLGDETTATVDGERVEAANVTIVNLTVVEALSLPSVGRAGDYPDAHMAMLELKHMMNMVAMPMWQWRRPPPRATSAGTRDAAEGSPCPPVAGQGIEPHMESSVIELARMRKGVVTRGAPATQLWNRSTIRDIRTIMRTPLRITG